MKSCDNCCHFHICGAKQQVLDAIANSYFRLGNSSSGNAINVYKNIKMVLGKYCIYWKKPE